jgi:hypothetical protein
VIFIRPRYCAARRKFPACSRCWALGEAICNLRAGRRDVPRRNIIPLKEKPHDDDVRRGTDTEDTLERVDGADARGTNSSDGCGYKAAAGCDDKASSYLEDIQSSGESQSGSEEKLEAMGIDAIGPDVENRSCGRSRVWRLSFR